jgi:two-component system, cell cycle sensor histidine kinase and response regulator CckA
MIEIDQLQLELEEKERRLQAFSEASFEAIFLSQKGICLDQNKTAEEVFGYSREEALGKPGTDWIAVEDREKVMESMLAGFEGPYEVLALRKNGNTFPCEIRAKTIEQGDGTKLRVTSLRDISQRKLAEKAHADIEARFRRLADNAPDLIYRMSLPERRYEYMSPAVLEMSGYPPEDFIEDPSLFMRTVDPRDMDYIQRQREKLLNGEVPPIFEFRIKHAKTGETHWIHQRNVLVLDEDGNPEAIEGIATDVTKVKEAEAKRLQLERQVQHAQKLESLGVLAGGIAHDFNNILLSILGNAELAGQNIMPGCSAEEALKEICHSARRAAELASQMLAYSGRGQFVVETMNLNELAEDLGPLLFSSISKSAKLSFDLCNQAPMVEGDKTQIRQVIMNLVTNASEALDDQGGAIRFSTGIMTCGGNTLRKAVEGFGPLNQDSLPEGSYSYLEVSDDGCGMAQEIREKIFDPFYSTKFTGRGLGMSVVQGIVRGHKGGILIQSELDKGSTFRVILPQSQVTADNVKKCNKRASVQENWKGSGTILLVDDEEAVRHIGGRMLERIGYEAIMAHDGLHAVEIIKEDKDEIRAVLLDLTMPKQGGLETFDQISALKPDMPIVLCSGYSKEDSIADFEGKGLAGFMQKPYGLDHLKRQLHDLLGE